MKVLRKVCVTIAAATLGIGLVAVSATSAEADSSWGNRGTPFSSNR